MTPEAITFTVQQPVAVGDQPTVTADRFPEYIAVADEVFAAADRQVLWVDDRGFLNIRVANGWATYLQVHYRPVEKRSEHIRVASYLEPRS